ncbi:MAG: glycosyltransferase family 4 protein [Treponema sp.]|nr:glycosyltransferase family 4 protein [Treponema sp.]
MKKIIINGESYARNITGIERVCIETVRELDKLCKPGEIEIVVPKNTIHNINFQNIKVIKLDIEIKQFFKWVQIPFQKYVIKQKGISLDFANDCPYFKPGIEYLHDIYFKLNKEDCNTNYDKKIKFFSCCMYKRIAKKAKKIIAVSEYTKKTIVENYHIDSDRVTVVYNGLSKEYLNIEPDFSILSKNPELKEKQFYFTLGSLSIRKNLKWIAAHAQKNPQNFYAISGKTLPDVVPKELEVLKQLNNVKFLGYLSDAEVKALMTKCKAFIFPSYFEGFGLPPLEALSCGAPIIIANTTCLPEIYGKTAHYIDADNTDVDLDKLLEEKVESPEALLKTLTVENSAKKLYEIIKSIY